jgi:hypothetical protein
MFLDLRMSPSSSGLGHWPFTPATGVRIPVGTPFMITGAWVEIPAPVSFPAIGPPSPSPTHSGNPEKWTSTALNQSPPDKHGSCGSTTLRREKTKHCCLKCCMSIFTLRKKYRRLQRTGFAENAGLSIGASGEAVSREKRSGPRGPQKRSIQKIRLQGRH